jgi:hypothetical protein
MTELFDRLRKVIFRRRQAYRMLFQPGDIRTPAAEIVLADLRKYCRGTMAPAVYSQISGTIDEKATFITIGRQEVFNRILQHLHVDDADLYRLVEKNDQEQ